MALPYERGPTNAEDATATRSRETKRRPLGATLPFQQALVAIVTALVWATGACTPDTGARADLSGRLTRADGGADYTFTYEALGSSILNCTLPNRRFVGRADRYGISIFNGESQPIAVTDGDRGYLHRTLFAPGTTSATWIEVAEGDSVDAIIGPDLGGYFRNPTPPSTPWETLAAALADPSNVERLSGNSESKAATFSIELDGQSRDSDGAVRLTARFEDRRTLSELTIAQGEVDGGERSVAGWTLTLGTDDVPARPDTTGSVLYAELARPVLAASIPPSCELKGS